MHASILKTYLLLSLTSFAFALPRGEDGTEQLVKRSGTVIANGERMTTGKINAQLSYQASGLLVAGGCPTNVQISTCWGMQLNTTGNLERRSQVTSHSVHAYNPSNPEWELDESESEFFDDYEEDVTGRDIEKRATAERQRIEIYSLPPAPLNSRKLFIWRSFLTEPPSTLVGTNFFHLWQLLKRDTQGPVITGDVKRGQYVVIDALRQNTTSIPIQYIVGKTIEHRLSVVSGPNGTLSYVAKDVSNGRRLLTYSVNGNTGYNSSIKFGMYRTSPVPGPALGYYGDYSVRDF